ncbi:unnamed protein product [Rangifer tarandus platyrhynchus]|uniref:Uncharacterized protein n=1 Tax=Rangifer tarandus platyrhynchus TaxID=3082113 RepID=A0AC59ZC84_RANTA
MPSCFQGFSLCLSHTAQVSLCTRASSPFRPSTPFRDKLDKEHISVSMPTASSKLFSVFLEQTFLRVRKSLPSVIDAMEMILPIFEQLMTVTWPRSWRKGQVRVQSNPQAVLLAAGCPCTRISKAARF